MSTEFKQEITAYAANPRQKDYYPEYYELLDTLKIRSVLDIGCASGDFLYFLPSEKTGVGIDISKELIEIAQCTRKKLNNHFLVTDITQGVPFSEGDFDCITMFGTLLTIQNFESALKM